VLTDGRDAGMQVVADSTGGRGRRPVGLHGMAKHRWSSGDEQGRCLGVAKPREVTALPGGVLE
jgi:hypothetical protein